MRDGDALGPMNHHAPRRTRAHLDRLLAGQPSADPLAELIGAAAAPAKPGELAGLDAALAVFASAEVPAGAITPERPPMIKSLAAKMFATKVLAVLFGVGIAGGVAYAATSGVLPNHSAAPLHTPPAASSSVAGPSGSSSSAPGTSGAPGSSDSTEPSDTGSPSATHQHTSTPSPSLVGLCNAWLHRPSGSGKADQSAAFQVLVTAAGGTSAVDGYCTTLLASAHPSATATPSGPPSSHHHGRPSNIPSHPHPAHSHP